jgi:murein DD-endopeptidase MepM/ murein hydrolase activator NlpD
VGLGVVAAVATLGVIPVVTGAPTASLGAPAADPADPSAPTASAATSATADAGSLETAADGAARATALSGRVSRNAERPARKPPVWVHPIKGAGLTSCYGNRWGVLHAGLDFAAPAGTPVRAAGAGQVVSAGWSYPGYGMSVLIRHSDGFLTHYAHLAKVSVRAGERVTAGRLIGREGSTGDSTGPHLHFEVHRGLWHQVDPAPWLRARGVRVSC